MESKIDSFYSDDFIFKKQSEKKYTGILTQKLGCKMNTFFLPLKFLSRPKWVFGMVINTGCCVYEMCIICKWVIYVLFRTFR